MNSYSETISRITSKHDIRDLFGTIKIRMGIRRNAYRVTPGLYSIGDPDEGSPVLVTANYKLTFDHLRKNLSNVDAWILVLDTKGINVWCAAGKGTFSTDEVVRRVQESNLGEFVDHRRLILPQLSAVGVAAHEVKRRSGFSVAYGPIRARDIKRYLANGEKVDDGMRDVTFSLTERLILTPLEILAVWKPFTLLILLGIFVISGISPSIFSPEPAFIRTGMMCIALLSGIFLGAFVTPTLLPWIPGRAFAWCSCVCTSTTTSPYKSSRCLFVMRSGYYH